MSVGLQALRAILEAAALDTFNNLRDHLWTDDERHVLAAVRAYGDQYGQLPTMEVLIEQGIRLTPTTGTLEYHLDRLRDRAAYNGVMPHHEEFLGAIQRHDMPTALAALDRMRAAGEVACEQPQAVPNADAVQRIMEKHSGYRLAELQNREVTTTMPVVHDLIGEGLTLLSSEPKAGKSVMLMQVSVAVVTDRDAFGGLPVLQGPVLHLALEDNDGQFKTKIERLELDWPDGATIFHEWSRLDQGGLEELETMIVTLRPRLVIIDTIKAIAHEKKTNDKRSLQQAEYDDLLPFKRLADRYRIAIVVAEHANRRAGSDPIRRTAGSFGKTGAADNVLLLQREGNQITIKVRGRNIDEGTIHLSSDPRTWRLSMVGPSVGTALRDTDRQVYTWMHDNRGEHRPADIARGTGLARETVSRALRRMEAMDPPRVHADGDTSSRTYIALPERVSVFELARRQGRSWGRCTPLHIDPDGAAAAQEMPNA
jgi:hypothetical protein